MLPVMLQASKFELPNVMFANTLIGGRPHFPYSSNFTLQCTALQQITLTCQKKSSSFIGQIRQFIQAKVQRRAAMPCSRRSTSLAAVGLSPIGPQACSIIILRKSGQDSGIGPGFFPLPINTGTSAGLCANA